MGKNKPEDTSLIIAAKYGDEKAMEALLTHYAKDIKKLSDKRLVQARLGDVGDDDLYQEACIIFVDCVRRFNPHKQEYLWPYVVRSILNSVVRAYGTETKRKQKPSFTDMYQSGDLRDDPITDADVRVGAIADDNSGSLLMRMIDNADLTERQFQIIRVSLAMDGCSVDQKAKAVGITRQSFTECYDAAMNKLKRVV